MQRANLFGRSWLSLWLLVAGTGACSSSPPATPSAAVANRRVQTQEIEQKPRFVSIERLGDPQGALALAIQHDGDSAASSALAEALIAALEKTGIPVDAEIFERGLALRVWLSESTAGRVLGSLRTALRSATVPAAVKRPISPDPCGSRGEPRTAQQLQRGLGWNNIALAAVGPPKIVAAVRASHEAALVWPSGNVPERQWPAADEHFVANSAQADHLTIAVRSTQVKKLAAAARQIAAPDSVTRAIARSAPGRWTLTASDPSLLGVGGCLALVLESEGPTSSASAGRTARSIQKEIERTISHAPEEPLRLYALQAVDPRDAASRAAWGALNRQTGAPERWVVQYRGRRADADDFRNAFAAPVRGIGARSHVETGQGRLWALLTAACPTEREGAANAGHTATALLAAAQTDPLVEAWISEGGLGLIASEPAFGADAPTRLAIRLARAIFSVKSESSATALARMKMTRHLATEPQWDLGLRLASDGSPSALYPPGLSRSVASLNDEGAAAAMTTFLQGQLKLVMLTTEGTAQEAETKERLEVLLAPLRGSAELAACSPPPIAQAVATAGQYTVDSDTPEALLIWPLSGEALSEAQWFARLLNHVWLKRGLLEPGLVTSSRALALGQPGGKAALVLSLRGEAEKLDSAVAQARALVLRLKLRGPSEAEYAELETRQARPEISPDPRKRLIELWLDPPRRVTRQQVVKFAANHLGEERLILVRPRSN